MIIYQSKAFLKQKKRFHPNQIADRDKAVHSLMRNPAIGEEKKGDLQGVRVVKFSMCSQLCLLSYRWTEDAVTLLYVGSHENFYRDLKHYIN